MPGVNAHPVLDTPFTDDVLNHVNAVAHKLARKYNRNMQDEEDIRSQLIERLMKAFPKYNPELSCYYTFAQRVVDCERGHVERKLNQRYREERDTVSLYDRFDSTKDDKSRWIGIIKSPYGNMEISECTAKMSHIESKIADSCTVSNSESTKEVFERGRCEAQFTKGSEEYRVLSWV